jgi:hypothetical protein
MPQKSLPGLATDGLHQELGKSLNLNWIVCRSSTLLHPQVVLLKPGYRGVAGGFFVSNATHRVELPA